jgi:hypothetical protein
MDRLEWWRVRADAQLSPLQEVKDALRATRQGLDGQHPTWREPYAADASDYAHHDARREYFVSLQVILGNVQLTYTLMKDQLCDEGWWVSKVGEYKPEMAEQSLREQALMAKWFSLHAMAMVTEETLRAIVRAGDPFTIGPTENLKSTYDHVLKVVSLQELGPLFDLVRLVRNTIHNNGVHRPNNEKDETVEYDGRQFEFKVGETLDWLGEDFIAWLARRLHQAMTEIVASDPVVGLKRCPRLA